MNAQINRQMNTFIVVDGKVEPTEAAKLLAGKIDEYAKAAKK